jgi:hypothetical protein
MTAHLLSNLKKMDELCIMKKFLSKIMAVRVLPRIVRDCYTSLFLKTQYVKYKVDFEYENQIFDLISAYLKAKLLI